MKKTFQRLSYQLGIFAALFLAFAYGSPAQVLKVKDFDFGLRDRRVLFDIATTPGGDAISFVAKDTGDWELYRVSNWLGETPSVKKLVLPGYFSKRDSRKDEERLEQLSTDVFVTRDGAYAVCVGSAWWLKRVSGRAVGSGLSNEIISVVDLSTFKIVATIQTKDLSLLEFHSVNLDSEGYVRVDSLGTSGKVQHGEFIRFRVPSLEAGPRCDYDWIDDYPGKRHPKPTTDSRCDEALRSKALADYLREEEPEILPRPEVCENNKSEFCRVPTREFTSDGKFGIGSEIEGHDNIFGSYVITSESLIVFSSSRGVDIGKIEEPTDDSSREKSTSLGGRDYLLVIQGGTHLMVFELRDLNPLSSRLSPE